MASSSNTGSTVTPDSLGLPRLLPELQDLAKAYNVPLQPTDQPRKLVIGGGPLLGVQLEKGAYEARVLQGIWAAAPYLHNGSVPTLAELLKPSAQRVSQFNLGTKYDIENVGLAVTQGGPTRFVTDCNDINSGNSRCGHDFGTTLTDHEKEALLEYLKTSKPRPIHPNDRSGTQR
jgi:hypothetical protein